MTILIRITQSDGWIPAFAGMTTKAKMKFDQLVLKWFAKHGRKELPWQKINSPYAVWLSEIMLQQTQVNTVIPYFQKFLQHFPTLKKLANTKIEKVLELWSGLGYYARARNLHKTAQFIQYEFNGKFPDTLEQLEKLPGIGRSTAGAILSLSMQQRATILDGNVKRVLCRFHAINEWPGSAKAHKKLWDIAEQYTPAKQTAAYNQAMMDLGALVCTRSQPQCTLCPLQKNCVAYKQGNPQQYPAAKPRVKIPTRTINMLIICNDQNQILLEKRPPVGIWGGLLSLPECPSDKNIQAWCSQYYCDIKPLQTWPVLRHTFSHFHLDITPIVVQVSNFQNKVMDSNNTVWYNLADAKKKALPAPIKKLLQRLDI